MASLKELSPTIADHLPLSIANVKLGEELRLQSLKDPLTGLYNRRHMLDSLKREIIRAERKRTSISVVMIDIDHFKAFNDTFGHGAGDELLRQMGRYLASRVRGSDVACRYGGEEFILFLPELSTSETFARMTQILNGIPKLEVDYEGKRLGSVNLSMGIATYPNHGRDESVLLKVADAALYRAKQEGRNRICIGMPVSWSDIY
jgi:diguanylate cyclase (GGDEF)-like protein